MKGRRARPTGDEAEGDESEGVGVGGEADGGDEHRAHFH